MMFFIFLKRYLKTALFIFVLLSAMIIAVLYENMDFSKLDNIKVGMVSENYDDDTKYLIAELEKKESYFSYKTYAKFDDMILDIKDEKLNYGVSINLNEDKPFTIYGFKSKYADILKEDIYSEYFKWSCGIYTKELLNLTDFEYEKKYEDYIKTTFSFDYFDKNLGKVFPILEVSAFLLYILSILIAYDYFNLSEKSNFFETFKGRRGKESFIISGVLTNASVYYLILKLFTDLNEIAYFIYTILLALHSIAIIKILKKRYFMLIMPFLIILSMISIVIVGLKAKFSNIFLVFLNNVYVNSSNNLNPALIYLAILLFINIVLYFKPRLSN